MAETEFGSGAYGRTLAVTPAAPTVGALTSSSISIVPQPDGNPAWTRYSVRDCTTGAWLDATGAPSPEAVWRTLDEWGDIVAQGLAPGTVHEFALVAMNAEDVETLPGATAEATTLYSMEAALPVVAVIAKESSTVTAPAFMREVGADISIDGKPLADFGFATDRITGLGLPDVVPDEELVPGDQHWLKHGEYYAPKKFTLEGHVHGDDPADLRLRLAYLKSFFATFAGNPWRSQVPAMLQRADFPGRHWRVSFESADITEIPGNSARAASARFSVTLKAPLPFAQADAVSRVTVPAGAGFTAIELGNAPSDAAYVLHGPAVAPSFSVGDMLFHTAFENGLEWSDAENVPHDGACVPAGAEAAAWRATETGIGICITDSAALTYTATGNPADGAWVLAVAPEWASGDRETDAVMLEHRWDSENYLRLSWDADGKRWVFRKRAGGVDHEIASPAQAFGADTPIVLGITWDATNAGGMRLFVDGALAAEGDDCSVLAGSPDVLALQGGDGEPRPDAVYDMIAGWSRMLSADEMRRIAVYPEAVTNRNVTVRYEGILDEGDMLVLDSRRRTATLFDRSENLRINAIGDISGGVPGLVPGRRRTASDRTQTVVHTSPGLVMEVRYRKCWL